MTDSLDLDALEAQVNSCRAVPYTSDMKRCEVSLWHAAPALIAVARERDDLREALKAAEAHISSAIDGWEYTMPSEYFRYNIEGARAAVAKIRDALKERRCPASEPPPVESLSPEA